MSARVPKYRLHCGSGQALVEIDGCRIYLGRHNSSESRETYRRSLAEVMFSAAAVPRPVLTKHLSIAELVLTYFRFAKSYYVQDGRSRTRPPAFALP